METRNKIAVIPNDVLSRVFDVGRHEVVTAYFEPGSDVAIRIDRMSLN